MCPGRRDKKFICTKCKERKPSAMFPFAKKVRHSWCRACHKIAKDAYRKRYRDLNPRKKRIEADYRTEDGKAICSKCLVPRDLSEYANNRGGQWCRKCRADKEQLRRREQGLKVKRLSRIVGETKECMDCHSMKPFSEFFKSKRGAKGIGCHCRSCHAKRKPSATKSRQYIKKYETKHRERFLALHRMRQFRRKSRIKAESDGTVTDAFLVVLYGTNKCHYCSKIIKRQHRTADHRVPLSKGGQHSASNLVMACHLCNSQKGARTDEEFLKQICSKS